MTASPTTTQKNSFISAIAGHCIIDFYTPLLPVILPFLIEGMELSYFFAGLVVTIFNVVSSITQPFVGIWGDKTGKRANIAFCILLSALGISLSVLSNNYLILLCLVAGAAVGHALFHPSAMDLINRISPPEKLGFYNSIFTTAGSISYAASPFIAGCLIAFTGLSSVAWFVLPGIIGAAWIWRLTAKSGKIPKAVVKNTATHPSENTNTQKRNLAVALVVIVCALRAIGYVGLLTYLPTLLVLGNLGMNAALASAVVTIMLFTGVLGQVAGGWVSDRIGRKSTLIAGLSLAIPAFILIFLGGWVMFAGIFLYAFFSNSCYVVSVTLCQELLPGRAGFASGLTLGFTLGVAGLCATGVGFIADVTGSLTFALQLLLIPVVLSPILALFIRYRLDPVKNTETAEITKSP